MAIRGDQRVLHDYLEWADSRRFPTPYREPTHRGIIRCALEVDLFPSPTPRSPKK